MAEPRFCLLQTLTNNAVTQAIGWDFNSIVATDDGRILAANEDGIFLVGADDFNGEPIEAAFDFVVDFGQVVALRSGWVGLESSGLLSIVTTFDDRTADARTFFLEPYHRGNQQHGCKLYFGRNDFGRYLRVRGANLSGADFSLDGVELIFIPKGRFRT